MSARENQTGWPRRPSNRGTRMSGRGGAARASMVEAATAGWSARVNKTPSAPDGTARSPHCMEPVWPVR